MRQEELIELHYIVLIANVPSVLEHGILSYRRSQNIKHASIAKLEVQEMRSRVAVPGGRPLHDYANLYFCARNPMMYLRKSQHQSLCVLRVSPEVLGLPRVVIADQNAASGYARFRPAPEGLAHIDRDRVFADYWTHPDDVIAEWRHKSLKCAEVLVPDRVEPRFVQGAYVSCEAARAALAHVASTLPVEVDGKFFFQA